MEIILQTNERFLMYMGGYYVGSIKPGLNEVIIKIDQIGNKYLIMGKASDFMLATCWCDKYIIEKEEEEKEYEKD
ncbi:MAG: hypothetical protein LIR50_19195 [Bacillota bacterium]|nr:hypothetical protein [Bacillota bacterium]